MTSPTGEATRIRCPGCGTVYDEWWHPALDQALEEDQLGRNVSSTCPDCGHEVSREALVIDSDDVLEPAGFEPDG